MIDPLAGQMAAPTPSSPPPRLYQKFRAVDDERTSGSQYHYQNFADFVTTYRAEANDQTRFGPSDFVDMINPLQHIPLLSQIYRFLSDDQIKPGPNMVGGAVFGGGLGLASSSVNEVVKAKTGHDVPGNIMMALGAAPPPDRALALGPNEAAVTKTTGMLEITPRRAASLYERVADRAVGRGADATRSDERGADATRNDNIGADAVVARVHNVGDVTDNKSDLGRDLERDLAVDRILPYHWVRMNDPERTAGRMAFYA